MYVKQHADEICFRGLMQSSNGAGLESHPLVGTLLVDNLAHEALKRELEAHVRVNNHQII